MKNWNHCLILYKQKVLWHRFAMKQALLTALSGFPYGQFMLIYRQLQIIEVKDLCSLSDKAETRNMFDFGKFIIYGAAGLLLQGTSRLSSITKQQRLICDCQKWSQSDFHKRSHNAAWRKLVVSGKPLRSVCVEQESISPVFAVLLSHFQCAIKTVVRKENLASLTARHLFLWWRWLWQ